MGGSFASWVDLMLPEFSQGAAGMEFHVFLRSEVEVLLK